MPIHDPDALAKLVGIVALRYKLGPAAIDAITPWHVKCYIAGLEAEKEALTDAS